jgi:short-subunit dehydrogenase
LTYKYSKAVTSYGALISRPHLAHFLIIFSTRNLAAEVRGTNILINAVDPGWVATDMGGGGGRPVGKVQEE